MFYPEEAQWTVLEEEENRNLDFFEDKPKSKK